MRLEKIYEKTSLSSGYGAGSGTTSYVEYLCPCGKGKIIDENDAIPGFRDHSVIIDCAVCKDKYELDFSKGMSCWDLVEKK